MQLRSVLKDRGVGDALVEAWQGGAALAAPSAGAMCSATRWSTCGAGLHRRPGPGFGPTVIPHHDTWSPEKARRTIHLAPAGLAVVGVDEQTAIVCNADGRWSVAGAGTAAVFVNGQETGLEALPGR